jgi:hypothetical protein
MAQVENMNGKPFVMRSFNTEYGGTVTDWQGGAFARRDDGCKVSMQFGVEDDPEAVSNLPEGEFLLSDNRHVRVLKATVAEIYITYSR